MRRHRTSVPRNPRRAGAAPGRAGLLVVLAALAGCGSGEAEAPAPAPAPPDLMGQRVMLLPARAPAPGQLDAELAFWLADRASATDWLLPAELQAAADRSPAWRLRLDALPRTVKQVAGDDRRVADPLYTALRQLGAVVDATYAVVPIAVAEAPEAPETPDSAGVALRATMAVVDIRGGRVLWLHTVAGERNMTHRSAVASVAEAVARALVP